MEGHGIHASLVAEESNALCIPILKRGRGEIFPLVSMKE
jgi:hypothetical protein